jgi:hypothetical protein
MTITGDYDMAIITLDSLNSVLSCRLTPPNALSMQYRRCVDRGGIEALFGPYLH